MNAQLPHPVPGQLSAMVAVPKYLPAPNVTKRVLSPLPEIVMFVKGTDVGVGMGVGTAVGVAMGVGTAVGVGTEVGDGEAVEVGAGVLVGSEVGLRAIVGDGRGVFVGSGWLQAIATIMAAHTNVTAIHAPLEASVHLRIQFNPQVSYLNWFAVYSHPILGEANSGVGNLLTHS